MSTSSRWEGHQTEESGIAYFGDMNGIAMSSFSDYFKLSQYIEWRVEQARIQAKADMLRQIKTLLEKEEVWLKK